MSSRHRKTVTEPTQHKPKPSRVEVLVSTSAPGTVRDDARYRRIVESYLGCDDEWDLVEEINVGFRNKDFQNAVSSKSAKNVTNRNKKTTQEQNARHGVRRKDHRGETELSAEKPKDTTDRSWTYDISDQSCSSFEISSSVIGDSQMQDGQQVAAVQTAEQSVCSPTEPATRPSQTIRRIRSQVASSQSNKRARKTEHYEEDLRKDEITEEVAHEYEYSSRSIVSSSFPGERTENPFFLKTPSQTFGWDTFMQFSDTQFSLGCPRSQSTQLPSTPRRASKAKQEKESRPVDPLRPVKQSVPSANSKKRKTNPSQNALEKPSSTEAPVIKVPDTIPSQNTTQKIASKLQPTPYPKPKALGEPSVRQNQLGSQGELNPPHGYKRFAVSFPPPNSQKLTKIPPKTNSQRTPTPSPVSPDRRPSIPEFRSKPRTLAELFPVPPVLEIHSTEPDVSSNPGQIPPKLKYLVGNKLLRKFKPTSQIREPSKWERGYWRINTTAWDENTKKSFWNDLNKVISKGRAGLVEVFPENKKLIKPEDGERCGDVLRLYCFGGVHKLLWTMLMIISNGKSEKGLKWVDGRGEVIIDFPAR